MSNSEYPDEPVTINDKRRIDPETGGVREGQPVDSSESVDSTSSVESTPTPETTPQDNAAGNTDSAETDKDKTISELTNDLQRTYAEFENYRRRTERDRAGVIDQAKGSVISELLVILDDLERAGAHGDLENNPVKSIIEKLGNTLNGLGLSQFGEPGETFNPSVHEAVQQEGSGDNLVIGTVYRKGYTFKDRVIRTAMVVVVDGPATSSEDAPQP